MNSISFWTIFILGPIPVAHIFLHLFLSKWRRWPYSWYIFSGAVWVAFFFLAKWISGISDMLFAPPAWLKILSVITAASSLFLVAWSIATLKPKRFYLWAVLKPESVRQERIGLGPYKFFHHPAYTAYLVMALAAFLGTGRTALLAFAAMMVLLMLIVMARENHELEERLGG